MSEKTSTPEDSIHNLRVAIESLKEQGFHTHASLVEDGIWQIERLRAQVERLRAELQQIADFDTYWTSSHYDDGKTEVLERSKVGNIRIRGHWGKRALIALSSTERKEG